MSVTTIQEEQFKPRSETDVEFDVRFGLPKDVKFCSICCMSNQRPNSKNEYFHKTDMNAINTINFDENGVCAACRNKEKQHAGVDWDQREQELRELCDKHRRTDGRYDCLVPGSGGKDSMFQAWVLKHKYNMHPLTVTWAPHLYTDVGWHNFSKWVHHGFDNILFTPNGAVHRLMTRQATINLFHPFQPFIIGQKIISVKTAMQYGINICFYGEMPGEYGIDDTAQEKKFTDRTDNEVNMDFNNEEDFRNLCVGATSFGEYMDQHGLKKADLIPYTPIDKEEIRRANVEAFHLGYYIKWDPQEMYYFSVDKFGFKANDQRTEGTYSKYNSIDDKVDNFFYYTKHIKFGYGRATHDASQEIRNKKITTEEGKALIKKFDGELPVRYYNDFLEYIGLTDAEFKELQDKFRSPHIWAKVNDEWKLRHTVNKDGVDD